MPQLIETSSSAPHGSILATLCEHEAVVCRLSLNQRDVADAMSALDALICDAMRSGWIRIEQDGASSLRNPVPIPCEYDRENIPDHHSSAQQRFGDFFYSNASVLSMWILTCMLGEKTLPEKIPRV